MGSNVDTMIECGLSPTEARMVDDVSDNAVRKAVETLIMVTDALPKGTRSFALYLAAIKLSVHSKVAVEKMQEGITDTLARHRSL